MKKWRCIVLSCLLLLTGSLPTGGRTEAPEATIRVREETLRIWDAALIQFTLPEAGSVDLVLLDNAGEKRFTVMEDFPAAAGQNSLFWNGTWNHEAAPAGAWRLAMLSGERLLAETRIVLKAPEAEISTAENAEPLVLRFTPSSTSPLTGMDKGLNYWTLSMDITDEDAVWRVLTAPITVADNGKGEKAQIILREEPSPDSRGVGSVTCVTQGLHVLQRGEEWSLVECYSSSFHDSPILNWNALVQGYVLTEYLQEITPNQEMGIVIDKLTQRMYVFREGKLFSTLLVSTGLSNSRQPYNETRSGEFLLTSKVGTFTSDNMRCPLAIRFNRGDLVHEVPYIVREDGSQDYTTCEAKLGTKASHGCIRIQRKKTPEGVNMGWLWANLRANSRTRLLIWEDWQGRQIPLPSEKLELYASRKNQVYHSSESCASLKKGAELEPFRYGELEQEPYASLKRCEWCAPALRVREIEKINSAYAFGGDHDPVLTEAREDCPKPLKR